MCGHVSAHGLINFKLRLTSWSLYSFKWSQRLSSQSCTVFSVMVGVNRLSTRGRSHPMCGCSPACLHLVELLFTETEQEPCWEFLLSEQNQKLEENATGKTEADSDKDCLLFEFSSEPLLPCYHVQVSLTQGWVHKEEYCWQEASA